ncbi:hypothetical protein BG004_000429 [Podila humilis]|nr:hypothetical protein BG004_000429 [Podila humilis]
MFPNQSGRVFDKENATEQASTTAAASGPHAPLVKQSSTLMTPTGKQPPKMGLSRTPSQHGKITMLGASSPFGQSVLRTKTNLQQPPLAAGDNTMKLSAKKSSALTRTFSAIEESGTTNYPTSPSSILSPDQSESKDRRRSITKRGSAKSRLVIHRDELTTTPTKTTTTSATTTSTSTTLLESASPIISKLTRPPQARASTPVPDGLRPLLQTVPSSLEATTTQLSMDRALESHDKVIVGAAESETKRRALTNDEDNYEIEYCPPPAPEEPFDPGYELDYEVLKTVPPPMAYQLRTLDRYDLEDPVFEPASIERPRKSTDNNLKDNKKEMAGAKTQEVEETKIQVAIPTVTVASGEFDVKWSTLDGDLSDHDEISKTSSLFGIKDLHDESKIRPPFDGFVFEIEDSDDEDGDDIVGQVTRTDHTEKLALSTGKGKKIDISNTDDFNAALGLDDLEDESKVQAPFSDFTFEL